MKLTFLKIVGKGNEINSRVIYAVQFLIYYNMNNSTWFIEVKMEPWVVV